MTLVDKRFSYVLTENGAERREVTVGDSNDEFMEIVKGINEGEQVVMNPRTHFADEIAELEGKLQQEAEAEAAKNPSKAKAMNRGGGGQGKSKWGWPE